MPKLPKSLVAKKERKVAFDWEKDVPKAALEPPFPVWCEAAKKHAANPYKNSQLDHPKIKAVRDKAAKNKALEHASKIFGDGKLDYPQVGANGDSFVRGRDSLRKHITKLFTSRIAYYDGAMGTMIQKENLQKKISVKSASRTTTCSSRATMTYFPSPSQISSRKSTHSTWRQDQI